MMTWCSCWVLAGLVPPYFSVVNFRSLILYCIDDNRYVLERGGHRVSNASVRLCRLPYMKYKNGLAFFLQPAFKVKVIPSFRVAYCMHTCFAALLLYFSQPLSGHSFVRFYVACLYNL